MDVTRLSTRFQVRRLTEADLDAALALMQGNPLFYQHCPPPPSKESILKDMQALPPRTTYADKFYLGFFDGTQLTAVVDLILHYPNAETAFIGFFMLDKALQGCGLGTGLVKEMLHCLAESGFTCTRLGYVKGNPQSRTFWHKNGFRETGVETETDGYTIVVTQRENGGV